MKYAIVLSPIDIVKLQSAIYNRLLEKSFLCNDIKMIKELQKAEIVIFVVSEIAMCSTEYQEMVLEAVQVTRNKPHMLLRLDQARIPDGFKPLQLLAEITEQFL
jgi:hypothetical protein